MATKKPIKKVPYPPFLKTLVEAYGISGSEDSVKDIIAKEIGKYADEISTDKMGNLIAISKGKKPKVMLTAHMDEVGLVVKNISDNGRMYFYPVGSLDPMSLIGQRVHVLGKPGMRGVITTDVMNDGEEIRKLPAPDELFIDTGLTKEHLKKHGIDIGAFIALEQESGCLSNPDFIYGKALDDRIGCYIITEIAKRAEKAKIDEEIDYVFTVQEEIGLYGAKTSAYELSPDWAIVVDITSVGEESGVRLIGQGPTVTVVDSATIGNRCINNHLVSLAKKNGIPLQMDVSDVGTTDALSISISKGGVPSTAIGVAIKNLHTTIGIASLNDIENCIKLILEILKKPPVECMKG